MGGERGRVGVCEREREGERVRGEIREKEKARGEKRKRE